MTLSKSRGMPTLSLKGSVCLPLFLFIIVISQLIISPLYAQDLKNRTDEMYHLGKVIISSEPLPDKVYETQKNKIIVSVFFLEKGTDKIISTAMGTGFVTDKPGVIMTARHVLVESLKELDILKTGQVKTNPRFDYSYTFMGTIITPTRWVNFPLTLVATGEVGTMKDMMAFRTDVLTMQQAQDMGDITNPNPLHLLLRTFEFADANIGEKVYITGYAPIVMGYSDKNNEATSVYADMINFTFPAEVTAKIEDMPINKAGIKLMYRIRDGAEPGFSGGLVLNARGQVVGMTISMSKNFVYIISSKDIKDFLKDHKLR